MTSDLTEDMEAAKSADASPSDELRRRRLAAKMFGVVEDEPVRFGRFVLMGHLGSGGVGTVHLAYDPQLDRRVALKLLRMQRADSARSRQRMLREAKLLARLSDPNIVPVYEAGVHDERVFIVMEFVVGKTLSAWVQEAGPSWESVLEVYMQAGRGLAAAHAVGLVHRDFKPDNAIRGDDGRVRVLDFGLAKGRELAELALSESELAAVSAPEAPTQGVLLTDVGVVMGTPAYMAPEQYRGADVGAEADQFSFCVALYEALYDQRPYARPNPRQAPSGELPEPGESEVPRWVFAALRRGLELEPAGRHASMDALLDQLERGLGRKQRRRQLLLAGLSSLLILALMFVLARDSPAANEVEQCSGGADELAQVWSEDAREAIARSMRATGLAYAEELWPRVEQRIEDYAEDWVGMRREACEVHQRGGQSDALFDLRTICLDRRLTALGRTVEVLRETQAEDLVKALEVVEGLPSLAHCADAEALGRALPPPEGIDQAAGVSALRGELLRAEALERAGRYDDARGLSTKLVALARETDYAPAVVEALLVHGRVRLGLGEFQPAVLALREAALSGFEIGHDAPALEALARELYARAMLPGQASSALSEVPLAEALTRRFAEVGFARALLLNNAGAVHLASGQGEQERARARELFEVALELVEDEGLREWELTGILINLALVEPDAARRSELTGRAVELLEPALGPSHPQALVASYVHSHNLEDARAAIELRTPVCERYARDLVHEQLLTRECWYTLAFLHAELGESEPALEYFERVVSLGSGEADNRDLISVAQGQVALLRGQTQVAVEHFEAIIVQAGTEAEQWWVSRHVARAQIGLADARRALGQPELEREALEAATQRLEQVLQMSKDADFERLWSRVQARLQG